MASNVSEYRYSREAQRRARLWLILSAMVSVSLLTALTTRWADLNTLARTLGLLLVIALLFTIRAQLTRIAYRCQLWPDRLQLVAPLSKRTIAWDDVVEVRRMNVPRVSGPAHWACTLMVRSKRGNSLPVFIFDDQLEEAERALHDIGRHATQARQINV
jgi:hypothetical protein